MPTWDTGVAALPFRRTHGLPVTRSAERRKDRIPQYVKGHRARLPEIDTLLHAHPGLYLAGNSYRGVSINACIAEADGIAEAVLREVTECQSTARTLVAG
jgi:protoporphyrinogen/coproporphyrinogen III oxidase